MSPQNGYIEMIITNVGVAAQIHFVRYQLYAQKEPQPVHLKVLHISFVPNLTISLFNTLKWKVHRLNKLYCDLQVVHPVGISC